MQPNTVHPRELTRFASDSGGNKKTPNAGRHFAQTPPTSGCYFQVKRDERIIIQLSFIYTQMHITFTHNYTHSRTHTHWCAKGRLMDKTNVPEGSYTRQGIPLADALFRKPAVLRLSEDAQTEKESHTFNTATGVIFYTRALHTPHMRRRFLVLAQVGWGRGRCQNCTPNTRQTHERLYTINYCTINTQHCTQMEWRRIGQAAVGGGGTHRFSLGVCCYAATSNNTRTA